MHPALVGDIEAPTWLTDWGHEFIGPVLRSLSYEPGSLHKWFRIAEKQNGLDPKARRVEMTLPSK